ncbi:MAG: DUF448 domain-containing protein [Deltaproteobacteria bacterium]|nr:DUF448 domain-containing protein [Deltaproteobacteria bacterium]
MRLLEHVPLRTCLGCGKRATKGTLIRFTRPAGGTLQLGLDAATGRGGYIHRDQACWRQFATRKGLLRSLRCNVDRPERVALIEQITQNEPVASLG